MKTSAVVGFLFNNDATQVVLIKKNKPPHLKGLWNGVGGKIEVGESPGEAMRREFLEETGVDYAGFKPVCIGETAHWILYYFVGFHTESALSAFNATDEMVDRFQVSKLGEAQMNGVTNRIWLLPFLLDMYRTQKDTHKILRLTNWDDTSR